MFDIPFLNDRLLLAGQDPVEARFHIDVMYYARLGQSRFTSSRLDWVSKLFEADPERKTPLELTVWKRAQAEALGRFVGGKRNYNKIAVHCKKDLAVTEAVYQHLRPRIKRITK